VIYIFAQLRKASSVWSHDSVTRRGQKLG